MGKYAYAWCVGLLLLLAQAALAQPLLEQVQQLSPLRNARSIDSLRESQVEKIYPLGSIRRISGQLRYTSEILLRGEQTVLTLQLAPTQDAMDGFSAVYRYLHEQQAQLLFWCEGRDCGSSNLWANAVFANARLYGLDDRQAYALFRMPQVPHVVALYAVTRGNKRAMLHLEYFAAEQLSDDLRPTPATVLRQLRADTRLPLAQLSPEPEPQWVKLLARALNQDVTLRISMGGAGAATWREQIVAAGVRANRIELDEQQSGVLYLQTLP